MIFERDPKYIAGQSRLIRSVLGWTQENLADAAGLSNRTVEKVESGRHVPDEQTLKLISRATGFDMKVFRKPTAEDEAAMNAEAQRAKTKIDVVPIAPVVSAADALATLNDGGVIRFDRSEVRGDEAMELAAEMQDWIGDVILGWSDISAVEQLSLARSFAEYCGQMRGLGFICFGGRHTEKLYDSTLSVGMFCLIPVEREKDTKYALVQMEGAWSKA
jgi:transcriptional regulator with XRE-family HTH domain